MDNPQDIPILHWIPYRLLRQRGAFGFVSNGDRLFAMFRHLTELVAATGMIKVQKPMEYDAINPWAKLIPGLSPDKEKDDKADKKERQVDFARALMERAENATAR